MGYRSEVAIKCQPKAWIELEKTIRKHGFIPDRVFRTQYGYTSVYWDCVKWYECFPEVAEINALLDDFDIRHDIGKPDELGYHFIRIGEDFEDVESKCNDYDVEQYIIRSIDLDYCGTEIQNPFETESD